MRFIKIECDFWINSLEVFGSGLKFGATYISGGVKYLPLEIRVIDNIKIDPPSFDMWTV